MKNEFVPNEEALVLKKLGFDEPCFGYYYVTNLEKYEYINQHVVKNSDFIFGMTAPTFSQAFRWFREKYLLEGLILPQVQSILAPTPAYFIVVISYNDEKWEEKLNSSNDKDEKNFLHYGTYEEAELACLRKLIELTK